MSDKDTLYIKQYDSLSISCEYLQDDGSPLGLIDVDVSADMQNTSGVLIDSLRVSVLSRDTGLFNLTSNLSSLPVGSYRIDILFDDTSSGRRVSSETFNLTVKPAVTKPKG